MSTPKFEIAHVNGEYRVMSEGVHYGPASTTKKAAEEVLTDWENYYNGEMKADEV